MQALAARTTNSRVTSCPLAACEKRCRAAMSAMASTTTGCAVSYAGPLHAIAAGVYRLRCGERLRVVSGRELRCRLHIDRLPTPDGNMQDAQSARQSQQLLLE